LGGDDVTLAAGRAVTVGLVDFAELNFEHDLLVVNEVHLYVSSLVLI
jgi:hypothetical protein